MHILLITHYYEPEVGAPQRRWSALVERLVEKDHSVTVLCPSPHYPERPSTEDLRTKENQPGSMQEGKFGETIYRMPYVLHGYSSLSRTFDQLVTATASIGFGIKLAVGQRLRKKNTFDVVISTVPGLPSLFAGSVISKILRIAHVAETRDAWPDIITGDLQHQTRTIPAPTRLIKQAVMTVVTAGQKKADAVVVTTEWFASILRTRGVKNVHVVLNGAEEQDFATITPLEESKADNGQLRVQYLGTVGRSQGLSVFIQALEILKKTRPDLKIVGRIVGEGAEVSTLKEQAKDAGVQVEFCSTIPRNQLVSAYEWADVELVTLRKTKPFQWTIPSKIFELLATQRRIVAAVEGSAASVIKESGVGSVVEPENAQALAQELERLADNPQELITNGSGVALLEEKYSYRQMTKTYETILAQTVAARRRPSLKSAKTTPNVSQKLATTISTEYGASSTTPENAEVI